MDSKQKRGFLCVSILLFRIGGIDEDEERRNRRLIQESSQSNEQDMGKTIANVVAENSNPKWIEGVRSRKLTIALGKGTADGAKYNVKTWGVDDLPS